MPACFLGLSTEARDRVGIRELLERRKPET
jgi:hypothetical protein